MFSHWGLHEKFQPPTNIWRQVQKVGICKALAKVTSCKRDRAEERSLAFK